MWNQFCSRGLFNSCKLATSGHELFSSVQKRPVMTNLKFGPKSSFVDLNDRTIRHSPKRILVFSSLDYSIYVCLYIDRSSEGAILYFESTIGFSFSFPFAGYFSLLILDMIEFLWLKAFSHFFLFQLFLVEPYKIHQKIKSSSAKFKMVADSLPSAANAKSDNECKIFVGGNYPHRELDT